MFFRKKKANTIVAKMEVEKAKSLTASIKEDPKYVGLRVAFVQAYGRLVADYVEECTLLSLAGLNPDEALVSKFEKKSNETLSVYQRDYRAYLEEVQRVKSDVRQD